MRLIDADALLQRAIPLGWSTPKWVSDIVIDDAPTIDAMPVTRCRDCKHRQAKLGDCYGNFVVLCEDGFWRDMEFFCANGERSEE